MKFLKFSWITIYTGIIAYIIEVFFIDIIKIRAWVVLGFVGMIFVIIKHRIMFPKESD